MKYISYILIVFSLFACNKQDTSPSNPPIPDCVVMEMERPALQIEGKYLSSSSEVQVTWSRKGKSTYTVQEKINNVWVSVHTCGCGYYRRFVDPGTYVFRVVSGSNVSNVVSITTTANPTPPLPEADTIRIAFDPVYIEYWNAFLFDTTLRGSGLQQWQMDSIMYYVRLAFNGHGIVFVTEPTNASQTCVVTESSEWYGSVGGVAYISSYRQNKECFVFSQLLSYNWQYIAKAIIHELGHTLGLYHTQNLSLETNWMSYVYNLNQRFETVVDAYGNLVNQPQVIQNTLN